MDKQPWWKSRSVVDDGDAPDSIDDAIERRSRRDDAWLDDFDFDTHRDRSASTVSGLWSRWGGLGSTSDRAEVESAVRLATAQRMAQGFADVFTAGDKRYRVVFSEKATVAGTDFGTKLIHISHRPLFDPKLTDEQAQEILTAIVCHEAAHDRYGRSSFAAIKSHPHPRAKEVSNLLGDVHDEGAFRRDWPGYDGVFYPAIDYIGADFRGERASRIDDRYQLGIAAIRYGHLLDWSGVEDERQWWLDWADRWGTKDSVKDHVAGVEEALAHIDEQPEDQPEPEPSESDDQTDESETDDDESDQSEAGAEAAESDDDDEDESESGDDQSDDQSHDDRDSDEDKSGDDDVSGDEGSDGESDDQTDGDATGGGQSPLDISTAAQCLADAIDETAADHGQTDYMSEETAGELMETGRVMSEPDEFGWRGEVYWSPRGLARRKKEVAPSGVAAAAIRNAFIRSRGGRHAVERSLRSGRLDNRSLPRLASDDFRVFNRRIAESEGKYRIWLLVDCSSSMKGWGRYSDPIGDAMSVAHALASAVRKMPNVSLDVWGWTTGRKMAAANFGATRVYAEGDPLANIGYLGGLPMGLTPDGEVIRWAAKAIKAAALPGETPVILMASDGQGSLSWDKGRVDAIRKTGVEVISVALGSLSVESQTEMYGRHGFIPWKGSIAASAPALGRLIGRMAAGKGVWK